MNPLVGHEEAVLSFLRDAAGGRLHHAWLISGPKGIGKSLFAHKAALHLLANAAGPRVSPDSLEVPEDHPIARLVAAGSHPDLMRLERLPRDGAGELARNITVEQVRGLQRLFTNTSALSAWRVVIIDSIDDLERGAANALLKNLEEPPQQSLFLLISHIPDRLLPTIRSRCTHLRMGPLSDDAMTSVLKLVRADADAKEISDLLYAAAGSPGTAVAASGLDIPGLDKSLMEIALQGDSTNAKRSALAQNLSGKGAQARYEAFLARVPSVIARAARERRGPALAEALRLWERAQDLAGSATRLSLDPHSVVFELAGMLATLAPRRADG